MILSNLAMERYIISGRIGEGAHGIVLKGVDKSTLQVVALKRIAIKNIGEQGLPNSVIILVHHMSKSSSFDNLILIW